ncbi:MAG: UPF0182 family protein [Ardenticatenaceae bacterium]|nr:UPF0182 family protein [Ardenticatenaceae bacterium]
MSRDPNDIPEVFRRAMRDAGWDYGTESDDEGRPPFPPRPDRPTPAPRPNRTLWILAAIFLLIISFNWIVNTYTDWLWFREVEYTSVWLTQFAWRIALFLIGLIVALVVLGGNWVLARRRAIRITSPLQPQLLKISGVRWVIAGFAVFLALGFASSLAGHWEEFLLFIHRVPFGTNDPIFNQDVSYYLFVLPIFQLIQGWLASLLFFTLVGVVALYAGNSLPDIQQGRWRPQNIPEIRRHVALLLTFLLALWAVGYWFDVYQLLYSPGGAVFGATYTDMNATLWALRAQMVLMALAAVAALYTYFRFDLRPLLVTGGLWLVVTILLGGLYPGLLQRYAVEPNELERERPYITNNITFTRLAYGLDDVNSQPFSDIAILDQSLVGDAKAEAILRNIRLWDYRPLHDTYTQLQALRPYYQFGEIDIDRYKINGETRQVMLAARELNKANLSNPTWVNLNLEFTHGFGVVMNPVDEVTPEGQPNFYIKDLPPQSTIEEIQVSQPEIYYGELMSDEVYVNNTRPSFSYPSGNENVETIYQGTGGVPLDNFVKRLAFALRLTDTNVILSNEIDSNTRVMMYRQIRDRVAKIAPFLTLDGDPYIVVGEDGRLIWLMDAYTSSSKFPYATPTASGFNYIRNAAKITVDAYDGTVRFYIADPSDPIIEAYNGAFPGLFQPLSAMPEDLQAHIRYPEGLFRIQTQQYLKYHMTDPRVFYNQEDLWELPSEIFDANEQLMEPYYVTMPLPGEVQSEYLLIQPLTPVGKPNMIAWMAARNDAPNYGDLVVYELPKQELVFGPLQVEGRIDQEPEISQQFSLWDQRGSRVIRGNLLVIPIGESFLYVEPVYLLSDTSALPELKRVIVATDTRIAMDLTLSGALNTLLVEEPGQVVIEDVTGDGTDTAVTGTPEAAGTAVAVPANATIDDLIRSANDHYLAAEAAQRAGDWATYGEEIDALQLNLQQLMQLTEQ